MSSRQNFSSGSPWEDILGYSRAVKVGSIIEIAGTTASTDAKGDKITSLFEQTKAVLEKISQVLKEAGASMENVTRTRMFVTDISQWEEAGRAHGLFFKNIKPVTSMVEVSKLIDPDILIEIEVTAVCD